MVYLNSFSIGPNYATYDTRKLLNFLASCDQNNGEKLAVIHLTRSSISNNLRATSRRIS